MIRTNDLPTTLIMQHLVHYNNIFCSFQLIKKGFKVIDALEPSEGMSKKALEKNIYRKMYLDFFTDDVQCLQTGEF